LGGVRERSRALHASWPAGLGSTRLAFDRLDQRLKRRLAVANGTRFRWPRGENQQYTVGVAA
jgi:hypothetical protein